MPAIIDREIDARSSRTTHETSRTHRHIVHVSLALRTGGLERLLVDFARFHDRARYRLSFVALHDGGQPAADIEAAGCDVHILNGRGRGRFANLNALRMLFRQLSPDVVHTHNLLPHVQGTAAAKLAGVPVVVHTRHGQRFGHGWWSSLQYRLAARWVDRAVSVSDDAARLSITADRLDAAKVARIWNGIDLQRFQFRGPADAPTAISVARLSSEKDFPTLLRAAALAVREVPEFRLLLVGDGAERNRLEQLVRELNLAYHVQLLGERRDIPELLAQSAFFVSSSLTEGVSLTLLEAMAVGLPVLATNVGGNPEVVADGETGRLVAAADPAALAAGIVRMCRERGEGLAMGSRGRRRVEEHFDVRTMMQQYEHLYDELLEAAGK
jgi:sugar transferase (PEP-CTERM/EpsH1 system associated)